MAQMNRVDSISANLHRLGLRWARRAVPVLGTAWPAWAAAQATDTAPGWLPSFGAMPVLLIVLLIVLVTAVAWRAARAHRRQTDEMTRQLREARARSSSIETLLDVWLWQSDARHYMVSVRPPHAAPTADWGGDATPAPLWERFSPHQPAALQAMLDGAASIDDVEVQFAAPGTEPRRGLLRGRAHADENGSFAGYHGTFRELGPVAASPVAAAVVQAPAPAPPGDHESFSFTVSHDLRAPIRVVEGFTRIVKEDYGQLLDQVGNDHLDRVLGAAARMNNMIDALLALSKLSSLPLAHQPVNLSQLAGYVADDLRRQFPDRAVAIEIEPGMQVHGDPTLLRVVVENLLGNAWKYTGKAVPAHIGFARHAQDTDTFTVHDNGAGFDMRFADRLFGVFQRLHSANDFPGTGVGLASVRRIVRRHGGEVWGEAEVGRGARFHFSLPQHASAAG